MVVARAVVDHEFLKAFLVLVAEAGDSDMLMALQLTVTLEIFQLRLRTDMVR